MDILGRYHAYLRRVDRRFGRAAARHPGAVSCKPGCFGCCVGLFEITSLDAALADQGLRKLPTATRAAIRKRGHSIVERISRIFPGDRRTMELDPRRGRELERFFEETGSIACPFLVPIEGSRGDSSPRLKDKWPQGFVCAIYDHRPHTCRTFGLALEERGRIVSAACRLNFRGKWKAFAAKDALPARDPEDERLARAAEAAGYSPDSATVLPAVAAGIYRPKSPRRGPGAAVARSKSPRPS